MSVVNEISNDSDIVVNADSEYWIEFLENDKALVKGLLTRKLKIKGNPKLLKEFGSLFGA